jgi:hypothetical protein
VDRHAAKDTSHLGVVVVEDQAVSSVERLRRLDLQKQPGVAETIDWVSALNALGVETLDNASADATMGSVLKYREDVELARSHADDWLTGT